MGTRKIDDELIQRIEMAFGFPMHDWQKAWLKDEGDFIPYGERGNGKTFAYILKLLLSDGKTIKRMELTKHADGIRGGLRYRKWFSLEVMRIDEILKDNGIDTRLED